jgi:zona occludens toxin
LIYLYSGTPGSGKSLHTAADIVVKLKRKQRVIANFPVDLDYIRIKHPKLKLFLMMIFKILHIKIDLQGKFEHKLGEYVYKDNADLNVSFLVKYAKENHKLGREGQTLLIIDECSVKFNPREYQRNDRNDWIKFFQHHRKLGYNVILIAQNDRLVDRQIRSFIEYDVKHRKANNFRTFGMIFSMLQIKLFVAVTYWYGVREKCGVEFFTYKKRYSKIYDSYIMFDESFYDKAIS